MKNRGKRPHRIIRVFCGADKKWYWNSRAPNGRITSDGAEGFATAANARRSARTEYYGLTVLVETVLKDGTVSIS